jgi:uncharacterized protein YidB (DUF937 family)
MSNNAIRRDKDARIVAAVLSLFQSRDPSLGGAWGMDGLVRAFQAKALGNLVSSWVSQGQNLAVTPSQMEDVLGKSRLNAFAVKAGIGPSEASAVLASTLPPLIDRVTPQGRLPGKGTLESILESLHAPRAR